MTTTERLLNVSKEIWEAYHEHPFVKGIADGSLDKEKFKYYMIQDYLYLIDYTKVFALGAAKAKDLSAMKLFAGYTHAILDGEMDIHRAYMARLGITPEEAETANVALDNLSYTSYMLRVAYEEGQAEVAAAILSCAVSYEVIAKKIVEKHPEALNHPFYGEWVSGYVADVKMLNPYLFPTTEKIAAAFESNKEVMLTNMLASFKLLIPSVFLSLVIAVIFGTIMGLNKKIREALHPVIYAFSVIPSILLSPFVLLLSPTLLSASIFLVVYNIVWATLFATITGIMTIDKRYLDKAATLELTGVKRFMKVILPAASPSILAGFVNSLRSSFVMLVFAEMYGGGSGMGYFVKKNSELGVFANTWVGFIFMVIVLVVVMQIFEKVKEQLLKWTID